VHTVVVHTVVVHTVVVHTVVVHTVVVHTVVVKIKNYNRLYQKEGSTSTRMTCLSIIGKHNHFYS